MADRDVTVDILARDRTAAATTKARKGFDGLKDSVDKTNRSLGNFGSGKLAGFSKSIDGIKKSIAGAMTSALSAIGGVAKSPPVLAIGAAIGVSLGSAAITTFSGVLLGAGLLGIGFAALLGGRKDRTKALADLDKAKKAAADAEFAARNGSAASLRRLAQTRKALADAQKAVNDGKAFKALDTALDNLKTTFREVSQQAAMPLLRPLTTALKDVDQLVRELRPEFTQMFSSLAPLVPLLTASIGRFSGEVVRGLRDSMPGIASAFAAFARVLPTVGRWLGDFFRTIFKNKDVIGTVTENLTKLIFGPLKLLGPLLSGGTVLFGAFFNFFKLFGQEGNRLWPLLVAGFDSGTGAVQRIKDAFDPLRVAVGRVWDALKAFAAAKTPEELRTKYVELIDKIKEAWGPFKTFLGTVWDEAWAFVKRVWNEQVVPWWEGTVKPWLDREISGVIDRAFATAKNKAIEQMRGMVKGVLTVLFPLPAAIIGALSGGMRGAGSAIGRSFGDGAVAGLNAARSRVAAAARAVASAAAAGARAIASAGTAGASFGESSWRPAQFAAAYAGGGSFAGSSGHSRTGGPTEVRSNVTVNVDLDGRPVRQVATRVVSERERRKTWRDNVGRR